MSVFRGPRHVPSAATLEYNACRRRASDAHHPRHKRGEMIAPKSFVGRLGMRNRIWPNQNRNPTRAQNQRRCDPDRRGRYRRGMPGGPGRTLGSRTKPREDFLADMHATRLEHEPEVIDRAIADMSPLGQTRSCSDVWDRSALPPIATNEWTSRKVRVVPKGEVNLDLDGFASRI
jgi:hypothetical protein